MTKRTRMTEFTDEDFISIREVARNIVALPEFSNDDMQDVEQELALGLFKMSDQYRSRKSSWKTFRWNALEQIAGKIKRIRMQNSSRYMITPAHSLNEPTAQDPMAPDEYPTLMDAVTNTHQLADGTEGDGTDALGLIIDVRIFIEQLPKDLQDMCNALMENDNIRFVAKKMHLSHQTVMRKMAKVKKMMTIAGLDCYLSHATPPRKGK